MTPEIKHALEVIRDQCRKHDCCDISCPLRNPDYEFCNGESPCRISERTPDEWDIEAWEKESKNDY